MPEAPAGSYDPAIDAQVGAVNRGLADQVYDFNTGQARDLTDYGTGQAQIQRGYDRGVEDVGARRSALDTSFARGIAALDTRGGRALEDYRTNVGLLQRRYGQLADSQRQGASRAGVTVLGSGAFLQAAAKRAANQGIEQGALDTGLGRTQQDIATERGQLTEDHTTQGSLLDRLMGRLGEDTAYQRGQLDLQLAPPSADNPYGGRRSQDRVTGLTRALREGSAFGLDASSQRYAQAAANGWRPPTRPSNEFVDPATGLAHRTIIHGDTVYSVDPSGRIIGRRRRAA